MKTTLFIIMFILWVIYFANSSTALLMAKERKEKSYWNGYLLLIGGVASVILTFYGFFMFLETNYPDFIK